MLRPIQAALMSVGNRDHVFELHYGGTLESASWANAPGFGMVDIAATHVTGSAKIASVYTASTVRTDLSDIFKNLLWLSGDLSGNGDILSVVARSIGGAGNALAGIDYEEFG
jgi:phage baseplate assembly protein gpV